MQLPCLGELGEGWILVRDRPKIKLLLPAAAANISPYISFPDFSKKDIQSGIFIKKAFFSRRLLFKYLESIFYPDTSPNIEKTALLRRRPKIMTTNKTALPEIPVFLKPSGFNFSIANAFIVY